MHLQFLPQHIMFSMRERIARSLALPTPVSCAVTSADALAFLSCILFTSTLGLKCMVIQTDIFTDVHFQCLDSSPLHWKPMVFRVELYKRPDLAQHQYGLLQANSRWQVECTDKIVLHQRFLWWLECNSYLVTQHTSLHQIGQLMMTCWMSISELYAMHHSAHVWNPMSSVPPDCPLKSM